MTVVADLDPRKREILNAVVCEFIATGEPAGSKTLSRKYSLGVSAATVRNTMGELEQLGLLYQPHTSAGRMPTDQGIRIFVDALMEVHSLSEPERSFIEQQYGDLGAGSDEGTRLVRLLSELTQQPAVVRAPNPDDLVLRQVRFMPLADGQVIAALVGSTGITESRLLRITMDLPRAKLERIHNYLNELVPGRTLAEARRAIDRAARDCLESMDQIIMQALQLGRGALADAEPDVLVHGQAKLVQSGSVADMEQLRQLMELLDDQDKLTMLLDATARADGPFIVIGQEHPVTERAECSVIAAAYSFGTEARGTLAVIGPRSMNYAKVLPLVGFSATVLSEPERDA